ncbi:MAG: phosphoribosylformylglycinamidine synthase subunit PurL [Acidimicrobiia bacterium]
MTIAMEEEKNKTPLHRQLGLTDEELQEIIKELDREPNELELAMFSLMWSEHCSYKSSKKYLKNFPTKGDHVLVGPGEGAGVIDIGDDMALAIRIESHNHPSAVEPHQGAATGVGGIIRDIFSMGARPIACLDSLRFGPLSDARTRYLTEGVVAGISGYGNAVGVPTVGGEVVFDKCYKGNPLVNVMALGVLPKSRLTLARASGDGNLAVLLGSSTGRDGIGGASVLASAGFDDSSETKRPSVQVGDPFTEKKLIEACLEILEMNLAVGVQDLGAGGISCATSEAPAASGMGIDIDLSAIHLRESGMTPAEIMISESQERMLVIVTPSNLEAVLKLAEKWEIDASVIGRVNPSKRYRVRDKGFDGKILADMPIDSLGHGPEYNRPVAVDPDLERRQNVDVNSIIEQKYSGTQDLGTVLLELLSTPTIASKAWIYSQYDHQLFLQTVVKPGADATLLRIHGAQAGVGVSVDGKGRWAALDPYYGAIAIALEAIANLACVGTTPKALVNNMNFGNPEHAEVMHSFSEVVRGASDVCLASSMPVVGGNVSFYNESNGIDIDPTPVFGVVGLRDSLSENIVGMSWNENDVIVLIQPNSAVNSKHVTLSGSELATLNDVREGMAPVVDITDSLATCDLIRQLSFDAKINSVHDVSDGGLVVCLAEMATASNIGFEVAISSDDQKVKSLFGEGPARFIVSVSQNQLNELMSLVPDSVNAIVIGRVAGNSCVITQGNNTVIDVEVSKVKEVFGSSLEKAIHQ